MSSLNIYGDERKPTISNYGVDISVQRADDLDDMAIERLRSIGLPSRALDVASASGGQGIRMAVVGAVVVALDLDDYSQEFMEAAAHSGVANNCSFLKKDLLTFNVAENLAPFNVIVCQRMIHYVPFSTALDIILRLKKALVADGRLYISASGLHSELGDGYSEAEKPVDDRFGPLSLAMIEKHAIHGPVCLYTAADLTLLLEKAGMRVEQVFLSSFGNIKAVAKLPT